MSIFCLILSLGTMTACDQGPEPSPDVSRTPVQVDSTVSPAPSQDVDVATAPRMDTSPLLENQLTPRYPELDEAIHLVLDRLSHDEIPDLRGLLGRMDVREITTYQGYLDPEPTFLEGQLPEEGYNSILISSREELGVSVQVWFHETQGEASRHFSRLEHTFIAAEEMTSGVVGASSFRSTYGGIQQLGFLSRSSRAVVIVSCSDAICTQAGHLVQLAELVESRLE